MSAMQQQRRKVPRGPLIAVAVVAVVTLLALVGVLGARAIWGEDPEPTPAPAPAPSEPKPDPLIRDELNVTAGEGGSSTSKTDPETKVGYEPTCKGAVEAATNDLVSMDITRVSSGEISREDYLAMVKDRTAGPFQQESVKGTKKYLDALEEADSDEEIPLADIKPEWGGFHVAECTEGKTATIEIISASAYIPGEYSYNDSASTLEWVDGDWRQVGFDTEIQSPATYPDEPISEPDADVLREIGLQTQWENYVNAPS